ncbi:hypothetical protein [Fusobacterium sp. PH5-44]|uniref:hypothetical protein n=1 Tax=unclassified Fusobacterium TaxID=2648384 RepID=UPI003D1D4C70
MYSRGEVFYYKVDEKEVEFTALDNIEYEDNNYIIAENLDGDFFVFSYDENEEEVALIEDEGEIFELLTYWKEECCENESLLDDIDDEDYYDREDRLDSFNELYSDDDGYF